MSMDDNDASYASALKEIRDLKDSRDALVAALTELVAALDVKEIHGLIRTAHAKSEAKALLVSVAK